MIGTRATGKWTAVLLLGTLLFAGLAGAHHHPEYFELEDYTEPDVALADTDTFWTAVYWIWGLHDRIHWIFILLMLYTCYHFRFFYGRNILKHPGKCSWEQDPGYEGERKLMQWHRLFWYGNVVLILIHAWEWLEGLRTLVFTGHGEFTYIWWPLTTEEVIHNGIESYPVWQQGIGAGLELFYIVAVLLWLGSCHFFRYFMAWTHPDSDTNTAGCDCGNGGCACCANGCACGKTGESDTMEDVPWILRMNRKHGIFMWMALLSSVLLLLVGGHL